MPITSGELAQQSGVNPQTVRFYEREGLLAPPPRTQSGYRAFPLDAVRRVRFIRRSQELGFRLAEIRELLSLSTDKIRDRATVRQLVQTRVTQVEAKIVALQSVRRALDELTSTCFGNGPSENCPILRAIDSEINLF